MSSLRKAVVRNKEDEKGKVEGAADAALARHVHAKTINFMPACRSSSHTEHTGKQLTVSTMSRMSLHYVPGGQRVRLLDTELIQGATP